MIITQAAYGTVGNIKAFNSTGMCRIEIEIPIEAYPAAVAALFGKKVLVTAADLPQPYGIVTTREEPQKPPRRAAPLPAADEGSVFFPTPAPTPVGRAVSAPHKPSPLGPLAMWAVLRCKEEEFQHWVGETWPEEFGERMESGMPEEEIAKAIICQVCEIDSRKELDTNPEAASIFHEKFRIPFATSNPEAVHA